MIYLIVFITLIILSARYDVFENHGGKMMWINIMFICFVLIAGLRWRLMYDTASYLSHYYYDYPLLENFSFEDYPIGKDPFYVLFNSFFKSLGCRFYVVQLVHATFVNVLVFRYISKHSRYFFTCLLFYAIIAYLSYSMEIMRGSFSIIICMYANDYFLERKWLKGYGLLVLAIMFHAQTVLLFLMPLFINLRLNKVGFVTLLLVFIGGYALQKSFEDYLWLFELSDDIGKKASTYADSDFYTGSKRNINYIIVNIIPKLLYGLLSLYVIKKKCSNNRLLELEPFVMIGMAFVVLQINLPISYRYVDYYLIYFVLFYSEAFVLIAKRSIKLSLQVSYIKAWLVFAPFLLFWGYGLYRESWTMFPYSSVIERKVDTVREKKLMEMNKPSANVNEY